MKKLLILTLALGIFVSGCKQKADTSANQKPVVKIGVCIPLSGNFAFIGEGIRNAVLMAKESLPQNTKYQYEIVFEDDQLDPSKTITAAQKLIQLDKVDSIFSMWFCGDALTTLANQNKVIHFSTDLNPIEETGDFNFAIWASPKKLAECMASELQAKGAQKIAAFQVNDSLRVVGDALKESLANHHLDLVAFEVYNRGERDFRTLVEKVKQANPDMVVMMGAAPELDIITKQAFEMQMERSKFTSITAFDETGNKASFEGCWYVSPSLTSQFASDYENKYKVPIIYDVPHAYDAVKLIVDTYENFSSQQKPTTTQIAQVLKQRESFDGIVGKITNNGKGRFQSEAIIKIIQNGKPVVIQRDF
ncbi:MAG: ABC transporter substrate-binding protein [Verrucomicrobiota bacterium]